jgi:prepilin-type N-terminal cleavage/methylation domain-containing protein
MRRFRHEEDGFSLIELLFAMVLGSLLLTAAMYVFTTGLNATTRINDRVDSGVRARSAMERITRLLDSQVCLVNTNDTSTATTPPIVSTSTGSSATFYADLNGASNTPSRYTLTYNPTAKTLTQSTYKGTGTLPNVTFASTPTTTQLAANVQAVGTTPVFSYFKFEADPVSGTTIVNEDHPVAIPFTAATAQQIVRVDVLFQANSASSAKTGINDKSRTVIAGSGTVATADPSDMNACP